MKPPTRLSSFHIVPGVVEVFLSYCPSDDPLDLQLVFACHKGELSTLERLLKAPRDPIVTFDTLGTLGGMILKGAKRGESGDIMVSMYIYIYAFNYMFYGYTHMYIYIYVHMDHILVGLVISTQ